MVLAASSIVSTTIVGAVVCVVLGMAARSIWKKKKSGGGCGCGCSRCSGTCPSKRTN